MPAALHHVAGSPPLYKEVEQALMRALAAGEWGPGDRLPAEPALARRFGVAVFTLRAGVQRLVDRGILLRRQGKGTFVALHSARPQRNQFQRIFDNTGSQAGWVRELVSIERIAASDSVAATLGLGTRAADRMVQRIVFKLCRGEDVVALAESQVPARLFAQVPADIFHHSADNLYAVFQERFQVNVIRIDERVRAARAGRAARALGVAADDPVLVVERIAYTFDDMPVELRRYAVEAGNHFYLGSGG